MNINNYKNSVNVSIYQSSTTIQQSKTEISGDSNNSKITTSSTTIKQDTFSASVSISNSSTNSSDKITYEKPKALSADELKAISDQQMASFKNMLSKMLNRQAGLSNIATGKNLELTKDLFSKLNITPEDSAKAAAAIAPGGEWSPEAVSTRILDMAKALSGGDKSKIDLLKNAVIKGFQAAEKQWGAKLPSITDETFDLVMDGFDEWEDAGTEKVEESETVQDTEKEE